MHIVYLPNSKIDPVISDPLFFSFFFHLRKKYVFNLECFFHIIFFNFLLSIVAFQCKLVEQLIFHCQLIMLWMGSSLYTKYKTHLQLAKGVTWIHSTRNSTNTKHALLFRMHCSLLSASLNNRPIFVQIRITSKAGNTKIIK